MTTRMKGEITSSSNLMSCIELKELWFSTVSHRYLFNHSSFLYWQISQSSHWLLPTNLPYPRHKQQPRSITHHLSRCPQLWSEVYPPACHKVNTLGSLPSFKRDISIIKLFHST